MRKKKIEQKNIKSGFIDKKTPLIERKWFKSLSVGTRKSYLIKNKESLAQRCLDLIENYKK